MSKYRRILIGKSLIPAIEEAQRKIAIGRGLEIFGVCGGIWASAGVLSPATAALCLGLLGTHLSISEKIRKFLFFGVMARNVTALGLAQETNDKLDLEISTDAGTRKLALVLDSELPENSHRVFISQMINLGLLNFANTPATTTTTTTTEAEASKGEDEARVDEGLRILSRLETENFAILSEESEIVFPETGKNFRLQDITQEKVKTMEQRMPVWLKNKMSGQDLIDSQANQQLFLGALTVGVAAVLTAKAVKPAETQTLSA